jgi:hypothetical protein
MSRGGRTGSSPSIHLVVVVVVTQMGRQNVLARIVVVVAVVAIVVVPKRTTIATVIVAVAEESVLPAPEVSLMIPELLLRTIVRQIAAIAGLQRRLDWMKEDAGLVVLRVLLLPHLQGGLLVAVVAMMPIICLAAVRSDGSRLSGQVMIWTIFPLKLKFLL